MPDAEARQQARGTKHIEGALNTSKATGCYHEFPNGALPKALDNRANACARHGWKRLRIHCTGWEEWRQWAAFTATSEMIVMPVSYDDLLQPDGAGLLDCALQHPDVLGAALASVDQHPLRARSDEIRVRAAATRTSMRDIVAAAAAAAAAGRKGSGFGRADGGVRKGKRAWIHAQGNKHGGAQPCHLGDRRKALHSSAEMLLQHGLPGITEWKSKALKVIVHGGSAGDGWRRWSRGPVAAFCPCESPRSDSL